MSVNSILTEEKDADGLSLEDSFAVIVGDNYLKGEDHNVSVTKVEPVIRNLTGPLESSKIRLEAGNTIFIV